MALLTLRQFHNTCASCGLYFETLTSGGDYGGPFLYHVEDGESRYIDPDADPVWREVDALLDEVSSRPRDDMHFAAVFHDLLARTIDHSRPGARVRSLWEREPCPRCGSPERAEFGPFEPNRLVTVDVAPVTHDAWAALPAAEKRDIALEVVRDCAL